ncbi:GTP cyclohydrolase II [Porticoccus sp. W117]|uniref:GTP cyclohydrolase II n=1 Tax=Porticoccus sp. W117 TaxID=3054777 RepID=UPI002599F937|nr:GTP cyclohydrolase II [Porticoccus sp. W117]MDM3872073.1 GTP cyclohydrolase II [Porticoccus sp. W117]
MTLQFVESSQLPTQFGVFAIHGFDDRANNKEHIALSMGDLSGDEPVLMRVHSECLTGDALFSQRCDCGSQLQTAMERIAAEGRGVILYLRQEGRGIGLLNKIKAYNLQDAGHDTVEANEKLGFGADMRDYSICQPMLEHLQISKVKLMTNNPRKVKAISDHGVEVVERVPLQSGCNPHNAKYLATKAGKLGHLFD